MAVSVKFYYLIFSFKINILNILDKKTTQGRSWVVVGSYHLTRSLLDLDGGMNLGGAGDARTSHIFSANGCMVRVRRASHRLPSLSDLTVCNGASKLFTAHFQIYKSYIHLYLIYAEVDGKYVLLNSKRICKFHESLQCFLFLIKLSVTCHVLGQVNGK